MSARRHGPRSSVNLLRQDVEEVAEAIKLRLMNQTNPHMVHVEPDGSVVMERVDEPRRKLPLPDHWLLGVYTPKVKVTEIEDDLVVRYHELRARRAA